MGYSPWGHKKSMGTRLSDFTFTFFHFIAPVQLSFGLTWETSFKGGHCLLGGPSNCSVSQL